jgi:peptidoglycan hydrolase-like protein with peptidoglycan-binding domain
MIKQDPQIVRQIQQALKSKGFEPGEIDGVWGPRTQSALNRYQREQGLAARGQVIDARALRSLGIDLSTMSAGTRRK